MTKQEVFGIIEFLVFVFGGTFLCIMGAFAMIGVAGLVGKFFGIYGVVIGAILLSIFLLVHFKRKYFI